MFATPTQPTALGQGHLHHWRRIRKHTVTKAADLSLDAAGQLLQAITQDLVIITPTRIHRNHRRLPLAQAAPFALSPSGFIVTRPIHQTRHDGAPRSGHQRLRLRAQGRVSRQIVHIAVFTLCQPLLQACRRIAQRQIRNAHRTETQ